MIHGTAADARSTLPNFAGVLLQKSNLARSTGTGLLVSLILDDNDAAKDESISVEIAWRWQDDEFVRLAAVKRGKRRMRSDIPDVLLRKPAAAAATPVTGTIYYGHESLEDSNGDAHTRLADGISSRPNLLDQVRKLSAAPIYGLRTAVHLLRVLGGDRSDPDLREAFWAFASDIGRRALRSFHLEPLAERHANLLRGEIADYEGLGLHKRIEELLALVGSSHDSAMASEVIERLEALVLFANLYPQPETAIYLVHALSAGLGGHHDLAVLLEGARTIRELVTVLRPFALRTDWLSAADEEALVAQATLTLCKVAERLREDEFDIPLPRGFVTLS
jgi:hypothetical protein